VRGEGERKDLILIAVKVAAYKGEDGQEPPAVNDPPARRKRKAIAAVCPVESKKKKREGEKTSTLVTLRGTLDDGAGSCRKGEGERGMAAPWLKV